MIDISKISITISKKGNIFLEPLPWHPSSASLPVLSPLQKNVDKKFYNKDNVLAAGSASPFDDPPKPSSSSSSSDSSSSSSDGSGVSSRLYYFFN